MRPASTLRGSPSLGAPSRPRAVQDVQKVSRHVEPAGEVLAEVVDVAIAHRYERIASEIAVHQDANQVVRAPRPAADSSSAAHALPVSVLLHLRG